MKQILLTFILCAITLGGRSVSALSVNIIPAPLKMEPQKGKFVLSSSTKMIIDSPSAETVTMINSRIEKWGLSINRQKNTTFGDTIHIVETPLKTGSSESYRLKVTPSKTTIEAPSKEGIFYALQTLSQLMRPDSLSHRFIIPAIYIEDTPRFSYRGVMIDVSRHFFSKEAIKKQIRALSRYKINKLHLHLTDAAGWRLEIKQYPELTNFAAWRTHHNWKQWWQAERKYLPQSSPNAFGGYYTQEDMKEIISYARQHMITIVPEIEMPSHSEEVLATYPALSCSGKPYVNADFCVGNEATFTFLENVLREVMDIFPGEYIHIGGDEASKQAWKTCDKCQKLMQKENLKTVDELQSYFIKRIGKFLQVHNKSLLGWDEILEGGLAPNATVMSWRSEEGGIAAVKQGHQAIMTPGKYCYLDAYQDAPETQPEAIGGYLPLSQIYSYNPIPKELTQEQARLILGVQANLWTEYIPTLSHLEYMMYPRVLALSEVAWTQPENKSWNNFYQQVQSELEYLRTNDYTPFDIKSEVGNRPQSLEKTSHLAYHKNVIYHTPYSPHYPAQGDGTLTDGERGGWTYGDGKWQGFIDPKGLDITIDLEEISDIKHISADFMQVVGAEVYLPHQVNISVSVDGNTYVTLQQYTQAVDKEKSIRFAGFGWTGKAEARYIRYQALPDQQIGGWIFTDEIIIK